MYSKVCSIFENTDMWEEMLDGSMIQRLAEVGTVNPNLNFGNC